MKCVVCKNGETSPSKVTTTFERDGTVFVFKGVPAEVCQSCGEEYISEKIFERLYRSAEIVAQQGVEVLVQNYNEAS